MTRPRTASVDGGACQTSMLKSGHEEHTVTKIDTDRLLDETTLTTQVAERTARGNGKTIVIDHAIASGTTVGLVVTVG